MSQVISRYGFPVCEKTSGPGRTCSGVHVRTCTHRGHVSPLPSVIGNIVLNNEGEPPGRMDWIDNESNFNWPLSHLAKPLWSALPTVLHLQVKKPWWRPHQRLHGSYWHRCQLRGLSSIPLRGSLNLFIWTISSLDVAQPSFTSSLWRY